MLDGRQDVPAFFIYTESVLSFLALILPAARGCNFHTEQNTNWGRKMCSLEKIGRQCRHTGSDQVIILITAAAPPRLAQNKTSTIYSWVCVKCRRFLGDVSSARRGIHCDRSWSDRGRSIFACADSKGGPSSAIMSRNSTPA